MERKTKIDAAEGRQDLVITREFDLPLDLLFRAYAEPEIIEQWMGTKVLKLENKQHGGYQFETSDGKGNIVFRANGAIHEFVPEKKITRTFEMENALFGIQLEFLEFESLSEDTSKLIMQIVYRSAKHREEQLKLPFSYGINMAHDRLEEVLGKLK
ncbi:SRPBCC family protein [Niabella beijingensis]|uniref:SRPBCC family protein n=1 Tax=Niabella beijingensis TaxID=2872700 RepID=UPI001CBF3196|nr:SRPBCC domain-containing protein [Niabella beijingensis]MBZ4188127.1 SRPBCC domain-containing protein [Niabella beijingensis]